QGFGREDSSLSESKQVSCDLMREQIFSITKPQHDRNTTPARSQRQCSMGPRFGTAASNYGGASDLPTPMNETTNDIAGFLLHTATISRRKPGCPEVKKRDRVDARNAWRQLGPCARLLSIRSIRDRGRS